ncbi:MAG: DNA-processing protein DprA [Bacteroidales bacterium]|nr:DNA-processing protein DprA [Bacteroidales bacterium]
MDSRIYQIALAATRGISCRSYRELLKINPDPAAFFEMSHGELQEVFTKHQSIIEQIESRAMMERVKEEIEWIDKHGIRVLFAGNDEYPQRLNRSECADTPVILYAKGDCDFNMMRSVAIVGTRRATEYGRDMTARLVEQLVGEGVMVVSGLAYGIDAAAHRASLANGLTTVGVLGHGLDQIYPSQNRSLAKEMVQNGGALITEYMSQTRISPTYFPARNRIIAAMCDATVVVEASEKGGALITAGIANSYQRDVFAVPGRVFDSYSKGCNNLIANNRANILRNMDDLFYILGWDKHTNAKGIEGRQQEIFAMLTAEEQKIYDILAETPNLTIEEIETRCSLSLPKIANALLGMELKNAIKCLPGKTYHCSN